MRMIRNKRTSLSNLQTFVNHLAIESLLTKCKFYTYWYAMYARKSRNSNHTLKIQQVDESLALLCCMLILKGTAGHE